MTLERHQIDGIAKITERTLPAATFEQILIDAGYTKIGTAPAKGNRVKAWWTHTTYRRIKVIYGTNQTIAITAYHTT